MKTLKQAQQDHDNAFKDAKAFTLESKEGRRYMKIAKFIKPLLIFLESNPTEEFCRKMKKDATHALAVLKRTAPQLEWYPLVTTPEDRVAVYKAALKDHMDKGEAKKHRKHIKNVNYILNDKLPAL